MSTRFKSLVYDVFGSYRPRYGPGVGVAFPGARVRDLADAVVRGRIDPLIEDGARAYELAIPHQEGWADDVAPLHPHLHAKTLIADELCALGSANLDTAAAYWEAEVLVVFEDPGVVQALVHQLEAWAAAGRAVETSGPAARRLLAEYWPSFFD